MKEPAQRLPERELGPISPQRAIVLPLSGPSSPGVESRRPFTSDSHPRLGETWLPGEARGPRPWTLSGHFPGLRPPGRAEDVGVMRGEIEGEIEGENHGAVTLLCGV